MCDIPARGHCSSSFVRLGIMTVPVIFIIQSLIYIKENLRLYDELGSNHNYVPIKMNCKRVTTAKHNRHFITIRVHFLMSFR